MAFTDPAVIQDEVGAADVVLTEMAARLPDGWEVHEGSPETSLAEAVGVLAATVATLLTDEFRDVYSGFANAVLGLSRQSAGPAVAAATFTMVNDDGYVVPAGTLVTVSAPDGRPVTFGTLGDWVVEAGQTVIAAVPVASLEAGSDQNGCTGTAILETGVPGVASVALSTVSAGGADEEPLQDFIDRAARAARRFRQLPITTDDYAGLALDHPSVGRALAVNLFDATDPPTWPAAPAAGGHVTIFVVDDTGQALSGPLMADVLEHLDTPGRVNNVVVHVAAPTYVEVDVAVSVWPADGFDEGDIVDAAQAAAQEYVSPGRWARDDAAPGLWLPPELAAERRVTAIGVAHAVASVRGVGGVATCTVNGGASVDLAGWAVLPTPGDVVATPAT